MLLPVSYIFIEDFHMYIQHRIVDLLINKSLISWSIVDQLISAATGFAFHINFFSHMGNPWRKEDNVHYLNQ